ncbi:membrane-flanked domain-containing protein [Salinisphaera sp. T5B8]
MGYIDNNLMNNERVIHRGHIHWFIFIHGALGVVIAFILFGSGQESGIGPVFGLFLFIASVYGLLKALITKLTTELGVTSKRVIAKTGFIRRVTVELNHSKVESFNVDQSILGRIFGFGTIAVCGTGGGRTPIPGIEKPLEFRRYAMQTVDENGLGSNNVTA